jgi:hypothetical protein
VTSLVLTLLGLVAAHLGASRTGGGWIAEVLVPGALAWALAHPPSREIAIGVATGLAIYAGLRAVWAMQASPAAPVPTATTGIIRRPAPRQWSVDLDELITATQHPAPPRGGTGAAKHG